MGVSFHYFSAPSDEAAASKILRIGELGMQGQGPYVETKLVNPALVLRDLEALLTGRKYAEVAKINHLLVESDDSLIIIARLTDTISAALAGADEERLAAVVVPWSQIGEFSDLGGEPEELVSWLLPWLRELAVLARRACGMSERLYCWCID
jgi:hypothetical protein